jgi:hypothetical protein
MTKHAANTFSLKDAARTFRVELKYNYLLLTWAILDSLSKKLNEYTLGQTAGNSSYFL